MPCFQPVLIPGNPSRTRLKGRTTVSLVCIGVLKIAIKRRQDPHYLHPHVSRQINAVRYIEDLLFLRVQQHVVSLLEIGAAHYGAELKVQFLR